MDFFYLFFFFFLILLAIIFFQPLLFYSVLSQDVICSSDCKILYDEIEILIDWIKLEIIMTQTHDKRNN